MPDKPATSSPILRRRVFLADDHPLVREWLSNLIERQPDLSVCGQAENSADAYQQICRLGPDIAVVDLALNASSGLDLIKQLQADPNPPYALVLSMHGEMTYVERALRAGARGYVVKRAATGQIIAAIRAVLGGKLYVSDEMAVQMTERYLQHGQAGPRSAVDVLSDRELEVFQRLGNGQETRRIAEELRISPKTVQVYCGRIKEKFGLENATELIREAVRWVETRQRK